MWKLLALVLFFTGVYSICQSEVASFSMLCTSFDMKKEVALSQDYKAISNGIYSGEKQVHQFYVNEKMQVVYTLDGEPNKVYFYPEQKPVLLSCGDKCQLSGLRYDESGVLSYINTQDSGAEIVLMPGGKFRVNKGKILQYVYWNNRVYYNSDHGAFIWENEIKTRLHAVDRFYDLGLGKLGIIHENVLSVYARDSSDPIAKIKNPLNELPESIYANEHHGYIFSVRGHTIVVNSLGNPIHSLPKSLIALGDNAIFIWNSEKKSAEQVSIVTPAGVAGTVTSTAGTGASIPVLITNYASTNGTSGPKGALSKDATIILVVFSILLILALIAVGVFYNRSKRGGYGPVPPQTTAPQGKLAAGKRFTIYNHQN